MLTTSIPYCAGGSGQHSQAERKGEMRQSALLGPQVLHPQIQATNGNQSTNWLNTEMRNPHIEGPTIFITLQHFPLGT